MKDRAPDMLRSTVTAGAIFGTLAAVPYLRLINMLSCCCLLILGCGFCASYFYSLECARAGAAFRPGTGASVGLISGAFYALTQEIAGTLVLVTLGTSDIRGVLEWLKLRVPQENVGMIEQVLAQPDEVHLSAMVMEFFMVLLVSALFATLGGLIGGVVFKRAPASPATPIHEDDSGLPPPPSAPAV